MSQPRSRRQIRPSKRYEAYREEHLSQSASKKYVLRFMDKRDIRDLKGEDIYLLWPDDGLWYPANVIKVSEATGHADVVYTTTDEEENIDLDDLIKEKSIALREMRPASHKLASNEIWDNEDRSAEKRIRSDSDASLPEDSNSREEEISDGDEAAEEEEAGPLEETSQPQEEDGNGYNNSPDMNTRSPKRRRVSHSQDSMPTAGSGSMTSGRPRRQSTMSGRTEALLAAERSPDTESPQRDNEGRDSPNPRPTLPRRTTDSSKDDFTSAEQYEQNLISQISGSGSQRQQPMQKRLSGLGQNQFYGKMSGGHTETHVRTKAGEQILNALEKVARENSNVDVKFPPAEEVAARVEEEMFKLFGNAGREYKAKYRTLIFNLRDEHNPDLRRRVMTGDIPADKLVNLSHHELASKQLSAWREEKEAEAMKNAVLDPQAASRFSTAAALATKESGTHTAVDWRDNTLATRSPPREPQAKALDQEDIIQTADVDQPDKMASIGEIRKLESRKKSDTQAVKSEAESSENQKTSDNVSEGAKKEPSTELPRHLSVTSPEESNATAPRATSFDWSTIRANALQERTDSEVKEEEMEVNGQDDPEYDPSDPNPVSVEDDQKALAKELSITSSNLGIGQEQVELKGRVQLDKAEEFMKSLKASRSRTLSLGVLRLAENATEEEKEAFADLERQYIAKDRCGVFPEGGIEYYLVAKSRLASGLAEAGQGGELPPHHLLVVAVHPKTLAPASSKPAEEAPKSPALDPRSPAQHPRGSEAGEAAGPGAHLPAVRKAVARNDGVSNAGTGGTAAEAATAVNAAQTLAAALNSGEHQEAITDPRLNAATTGQASTEELANQLMIPQGIDLSSLGSLAAVLGVSQGLNLLVDKQQEASSQPQQQVSQPVASQSSFPGSFQQPLQQQPPGAYPTQGPAGYPGGDGRLPHSAPQMQQMQGLQSQQQPWPPHQGIPQPAGHPGFQPPGQYPPAGPHMQTPPGPPPQQVLPGPPSMYPGPPQQHTQQPHTQQKDPNAGRPQPQQQVPEQWQQFQPMQGPGQHTRPITLQPPRPSYRPHGPPRPMYRPPPRRH